MMFHCKSKHALAATILVIPLLTGPCLAQAGSEEPAGDKKQWRPPFVGGVRGPMLGLNYNGLLQFDGADFSNDDSGELEDGMVIRRARLTFARKVSKFLSGPLIV